MIDDNIPDYVNDPQYMDSYNRLVDNNTNNLVQFPRNRNNGFAFAWEKLNELVVIYSADIQAFLIKRPSSLVIFLAFLFINIATGSGILSLLGFAAVYWILTYVFRSWLSK